MLDRRGMLLAVAAAMVAARDGEAAAPGGGFGFEFTSIEGEPLPLSRFAGKPLLVVNTASMCGYTYQYAGLQRVWTSYRDRGLTVLGVPSNDFGNQEPGKAAEIKTFCEVNFDVDFPLTEKVHVKGPQSHPLFVWFRDQAGDQAGPRWNFHKYLLAPDGHLAGAWPSSVEPDLPTLAAAIEAVLPAS